MTHHLPLNPAQKQAVETIDGPVLVVAGPGTGKTQLLSARVANILQQTDTDPASILVLTFTKSGTEAVRRRLSQLVGAAGLRVTVRTFHSFCQDIIDEWPEKFVWSDNLQLMDDLDKILLWREVIDEAQPELLSTFGDKYFYVGDLQSRVSELKRDGITPATFKKHVQEWIAELDANPELSSRGPTKGRPKATWLKKRKSADKTLELAELYDLFQSKMKKRGLYDFDDMVALVVSQLKSDRELRAELAERFMYILVDEYQDTNSAQNEILRLLGEMAPEARPNIMVVGDDDQSIYRFQGASLENILFFENTFRDPAQIVLTENYRSVQPILDIAQQSIAHNEQRLAVDKNLHADRAGGVTPAWRQFENDLQEKKFLLDEIHFKTAAGAALQDIAILTRTNKEGEEMARFLRQQDIPATFTISQNLLDIPEIKLILDHITLLCGQADDETLTRILMHPSTPVARLDVLKIFEYAARKNFGLKWQKSIWQYLTDLDALAVVELQDPDAISTWLDRIKIRMEQSAQLSLSEFFAWLVDDLHLIKNLSDPESRLRILSAVYELSAQIETFTQRSKNPTLKNFWERMQLHRELGVRIAMSEWRTGERGVQIMTAHGAKGLEFPFVYIPNCTDGNWGNRRSLSKITLPPNLFEFQKGRDELEEERRLFYVALTRARDGLCISWADRVGQGDEARSKQPSPFVTELGVTPAQVEFDAANDLDFLEKQIVPATLTVDECEILQQKITEHKLSFTSLHAYLTCPHQFSLRLLYPQIKAKNKYMSFGTAVHTALEKFFEKYKQDAARPELQFLLDSFRAALKREDLTHDDRRDLEKEGERALTGYFEKYRDEMAAPLANEFNFSRHNVHLDDVPLTGKVDKIEPAGRPVFGAAVPVRVVDYKTGNAKSENEILGQTKTGDGRLWQQLLFYKILTQNDPQFARQFEMVEGQLDFVQGKKDDFKKVSFEINPDEVRELEELIRATWRKILQHEFAPDPSFKNCQECPYRELCESAAK